MINWGMIGCGSVTELKSGPAFKKVKNSNLIAVMRRDKALAEDYAKRHNVPRVYNDALKLINDPDVNAVYIATPPGSHAEYALKVIEAGKPVYIEKPMALNYPECEKINKAAAKKNIPVFVAYYRRTLPGFLLIRNLIEKGEIGKIRFIRIQLFKSLSADEITGNLPWRLNPELSGGGHFFDLASHQLDYLDFLFGPIQRIESLVLNLSGFYKAEDFISAGFLFPGNIAAAGTWCFSVASREEKDILEFYGEKGIIKTSTFSFEPVVVENERGRQEFVNERPENIQYYLIEQIVNELSGKGKAVSSGITASRTSRIMDKVVKDFYKDKR